MAAIARRHRGLRGRPAERAELAAAAQLERRLSVGGGRRRRRLVVVEVGVAGGGVEQRRRRRRRRGVVVPARPLQHAGRVVERRVAAAATGNGGAGRCDVRRGSAGRAEAGRKRKVEGCGGRSGDRGRRRLVPVQHHRRSAAAVVAAAVKPGRARPRLGAHPLAAAAAAAGSRVDHVTGSGCPAGAEAVGGGGGEVRVGGGVLAVVGGGGRDRVGLVVVVVMVVVRRDRERAVCLAVEVAERVRVGMHHWRRRRGPRRARRHCRTLIIISSRARPAARKYIRRRKSVCRRTHAAVCRPASATAAAETDGTGEWQPRRPRPGRDGRDWRGARRAVYSSFKPTEQLDDTIDSLVRRAPPGKLHDKPA